jgi:hypothetical protein
MWAANWRPGRSTSGKEPQYPLNERLCGTQSCSGHFGKEKNLFPLPEYEPEAVHFLDQSLYRPCDLGLRSSSSSSNNNNDNNNGIWAMWKQIAAKVILIVISSTGVIPKSLPQNLKRLNLHPNTYKRMQKSVILSTCSIVRNFLNYK